MIHLTYSNRTEALLDSLAADLSAAREQGRSPFERVRIVVPNRNVETWLKHGLARRMGIAANLEILLLRRFVGGLLQHGLRGEEARLRLVDGAILQDLLLSLLLDEDYLRRDEVARVRSYLHAAGEARDAVDLRRLQLATELSRLFEEYGFSRPELLNAWPREPLLEKTPFAETEAWQRRLWIDLFGAGGLAERRGGERLVHLPAILDRLRDLELGDGGATYLFGVSYFASAFHRLLARIGERSALHVYTLNPCMEFWEDVEDGHAARKRLSQREGPMGDDILFKGEDPFGLLKEDTPALSLWGRPGRENIRLLNALTDCDFRAAFEELEGRPTLLRQLQQDILVREPRRSGPDPFFDFVGDTSVRILPAPGLRRECETIAEEIWHLVHRDAQGRDGREPLRFNEIAVLIAGSDPQAYFTHLAAVFEETYGIPFNRTGSTFAAESRIAEAIELLLALPKGGFSRPEMLAFLTHPNVLAAYPDADPSEWARACERLGIVRGADHRDLEGSYVEEDLLSWAQGLRRMALGSFLSGDEVFDLEGARYLPEELSAEMVGSFGVLVSTLLSHLEDARRSLRTTAAWGASLGELVEALIVPRTAAEERELETCLRTLRGISELELDGREIAFGLAAELALQSLGGIAGSRGQYLADGVVVSTLQPMRAIPFRAIFIAGLGQGRFPAAERRNVLDLRLAKPRAGDITPREGDQYMFLEALLCARDRLYLSYVARDQLTGAELLPSPVLVELERILTKDYGASSLRRQIPLRRFEEPGPFSSPAVLREAAAAAVLGDLQHQLGAESGAASPAIPALDELLGALSPDARSFLVRAMGLEHRAFFEAGEVEGGDPDSVILISRSNLRKFLEDPLQGCASLLLGLQGDDEDPAALEAEALGITPLIRSQLLPEVFLRAVREANDEAGGGRLDRGRLERCLEVSYQEAALRRRLEGSLPSGFFGEVEEEKRLAELQRWAQRFLELQDGQEEREVEVLRFGKAQEEREGEVSREGLRLEVEIGGRTRIVEVVGSTEALVLRRRGSLILKTIAKDKVQEGALRGFLDHVLLAASGERGGDDAHTAYLCAEGKIDTIRFAPISREEATVYLRGLVEDLFSRVHDYFLPFRAVCQHPAGGEGVVRAAESLREDQRYRSYGPVRDAKRYEPPPEEEATAMIERRFGLFFRAQEEGSEEEGS